MGHSKNLFLILIFVLFAFMPPAHAAAKSLKMAYPGQEIWLEGEDLRLQYEDVDTILSGRLGPKEVLLGHLQRVHVLPRKSDLKITVYFDESFLITLLNPAEARRWQAYQIRFPKTLRISLKVVDGVLWVQSLNFLENSLRLYANLPLMPNGIYFKNLAADLVAEKVRVEAGVMGGRVRVVADTELFDWSFDNLAFWESIRRNLFFFRSSPRATSRN